MIYLVKNESFTIYTYIYTYIFQHLIIQYVHECVYIRIFLKIRIPLNVLIKQAFLIHFCLHLIWQKNKADDIIENNNTKFHRGSTCSHLSCILRATKFRKIIQVSETDGSVCHFHI